MASEKRQEREEEDDSSPLTLSSPLLPYGGLR